MPVRSFRPLTENDASNRAHHDNSQRGCSSLPYCNAPNSGTLRIVNTSLTTTAHHGAPASLPRDAPPSAGLRRASSRLTHLLQLRPRLPCVPVLLELRLASS